MCTSDYSTIRYVNYVKYSSSDYFTFPHTLYFIFCSFIDDALIYSAGFEMDEQAVFHYNNCSTYMTKHNSIWSKALSMPLTI